MNKYEKIKDLGEGGFGKAVLAKRKVDGKLFVLKEIKLSNLSNQDQVEAIKEAKLLSSLHSPFIISYEESFRDGNFFYIVMEYADAGDLSQKIQMRGNKLFTEDEVLKDFIQLALAIKHIHDRKILHRDLKAQNVFIMRDGTIKLGDFGIAKVMDHSFQLCKTQIGSPYYISPEICEGKGYNSKTDIWSLGCILYELCTLRHAFKGNNISGLLMNIIRGKFAPIPPTFSKDLKQLIQRMLTKDPNLRPSINAILATPIIRARLSKFLSETLNKKSQVRPNKNYFAANGRLPNQNDDIQMEVKPATRIDRGPICDRHAAEIEALLEQKRESKYAIISPSKNQSKEETNVFNTTDSYLNKQIKNKPKWAQKNSPKFIEMIDESTEISNDEIKRLSTKNQKYSNKDVPLIATPKNRACLTPQRSFGSSRLTLTPPLSTTNSSLSSSGVLHSDSNNKKQFLIQYSPPQRRAVSRLNGGKIKDEEFDRIFAIKKRESEIYGKNINILEKKQSKISPIYPFVDDKNRRKIQLQRAEIENKRARMKNLEFNIHSEFDEQIGLNESDQDLLDEVTQELDNDPRLALIEESVRQRCKSNISSPRHSKVNFPISNIKKNKKMFLNTNVKSPQDSIDHANYHLQSVQCLADSIREALLLKESEQNDVSYVETPSSPLIEQNEQQNYMFNNSDQNSKDSQTLKENENNFISENQEKKFPVVKDSDSISYRAEAIRAFLEKELGIERLIEIRKNLMNPDLEKNPFDLQIKDVEPGLIILAQQLVILDEMILK